MPNTVEPQDFLSRPRSSLKAFARADAPLRAAYMDFYVEVELGELLAETTETRARLLHTILEESCQALELLVALAAFVEAADELAILSSAELRDRFEEVRGRARNQCGFDPIEKISLNLPFVRDQLASEAQRSDYVFEETFKPELLLQGTQSFLEACPIRALETVAESIARPELGFRSRVAYDGLRGFIRRHDRSTETLIRIVGGAFRDGSATVQEVARALDLSVPACLEVLQQYSYQRTPERIALPADERDRIYAALRADRTRRGGRPEADPELVKRDVLATQRIEGIDASAWL